MLFSIPGLVKGTADTVTLNKAELLALAPVAADEFFSDGANIQLVIAEWNSNPGSQREVAIFKFSDATPSHEFLVSESAQDVFELEQLILVDFDNGELRLDRAALDAAISGGVEQFDIDFAAGGGPTLSVTSGLEWWFKADSLALADGASVTSWADEQGGLSLTTEGSAPSYVASAINGLPAVRSTATANATPKALKMARGITSTFSTFIVLKRGTGAGTDQLVWAAGDYYANTPRTFLMARGSNLDSFSILNSYGDYRTHGAVTTSSPAVIAATTQNSTQFTGFLNGSQSFSVSGSFGPGDNNKIFLFGVTSATGQNFAGDIAEFIVYNRVLSTQEIADVHAYLGEKYAITVA